MEFIERKIAKNGIDIHVIYPPRIESDIHILLVHGYAEHSARYKHLMEAFYKNGWNTSAYDLRGHGKSGGERVNVKSFDKYVEDLKLMIEYFGKLEKQNFVFAHSMGGLITLRYIQNYGGSRIKGLILSSPALKPDASIPKFLIAISGIVAGILPSLPTIKLDGSTISRDPEEVRKYNEDPLVYRGGTKARLGYQMTKSMKLAKAELNLVKTPMMISYGTDDQLIDPEGSKWIYEGIKSQDKEIVAWEGYYHEIINEFGKEDVIESYVQWIKKRIRKKIV